jgi:GTP diphosphokinase / guanosine-3',5'-bis(diphosphate) 3'-diphosphatase
MIINRKMKENLNKIFDALEFASFRHRFQKRKGAGGIPYINHPVEVTNLLLKTIENPSEKLLIAALLHDVIEDTDTSEEDIRSSFGDEVLQLVKEVTDDMHLPRKERKRLQIVHSGALSPEAKYIKIADKACNVKDIINTRHYWTKQDKISYIEWAIRVVDQMHGTHRDLETVFFNNVREAQEKLKHDFDIRP